MVLKIVRYLGQQGYRTNNLVILTPYLGQLQNLRLVLAQDSDPVLNDLDSHDLLQAGLTSPAAAKLNKKPIRLATIGSYPIQLSSSPSLMSVQTTIKEKRATL